MFGSRVIDQIITTSAVMVSRPPISTMIGMRTYVVPREDQIPNRSLSSCCFFMDG